MIYCVLGLMMLIVAIGVTAGTADKASQKGGLYVLYLGKILNIAPKIYEGSVHVKKVFPFEFDTIFLIIYISGLFIITIALLLRGTYYLTMKASHVDGPV